MISVVVNGRNDTYSRNLQKRVAISFNCLAEILGTQDEIVFVDYDTPNALTTFPEAIADSLTQRAKSLLRVLRVRPSQHYRLARSTTAIIDTIARNVGIRRTNPANRWILSTTTDMVLIPREDSLSLSEIAAKLPDGLYSLPRFEVPELIWESFDRGYPQETMRRLPPLSSRLYLEEIVLADPDIGFDNPGDFQLLLREDAFALQGFDEAMSIGWQHSDANLARRATLLRGRPVSLEAALAGYHLAHNLQAPVNHAVERIENDNEVFNGSGLCQIPPTQPVNWGLSDQTIEEIRLPTSRTARILDALERCLPPPTEVLKASRRHEDFGSAVFAGPHVLAHLLDQLANRRSGETVAYFGFNWNLLRLIRDALNGAGVSLVLRGVGPGAAASVADLASVVIIDFGRERHGKDQREYDFHRSAMKSCFLSIAEHERRRVISGAEPRSIVCLDAIHNEWEALVEGSLTASFAPFSTRIRTGTIRVNECALLTADEFWKFMQQRVGREFEASEISRLLSITRTLVRHPAPQAVESSWFREPLSVALEWPHLARWEAVSSDRVAEIAALVEAMRPSKFIASKIRVPIRDSGANGPTVPAGSLAAVESWDNADWFSDLQILFSRSAGRAYFRRSRDIWERCHMFHVAKRAGVLSDQARVAVISEGGDYFSELLRPHAAEVICINDVSARRGRLFDVPDGDCYDAVFLLGNKIAEDGPTSFVRWLSWIERNLRIGGLALVSWEVALDDGPVAGLSGTQVASETFPRALRQWTALEACEFDPSISMATLDGVVARENAERSSPHMIVEDQSLHTCSVWTLKRQSGTSNWSAFLECFSATPLIESLHVTGPGIRQSGSIRVPEGSETGHAVFGPYVSLIAGSYRLILKFVVETLIDHRAPITQVEILADEHILAVRRLAFGNCGSATELVPFSVGSIDCVISGRAASIQYRLSNLGGSAWRLEDASVERVLFA